MEAELQSLIRNTLLMSVICIPSLWFAVRISRHDEWAMNRARNLAKAFFLPVWIVPVFHRIFAPMALIGGTWVIALGSVTLLAVVGMMSAESIQDFYDFFIVYWPLSAIMIPVFIVTVLLFGRPKLLIPRFDRDNPAGLTLRKIMNER